MWHLRKNSKSAIKLLRMALATPPYSPNAKTRRFGIHNEAQISPIQDARNSDMALFAEFAVQCVLDCSCPLSSAEGGDFLEASGWA
jgi:hypothetical protein